MQLDGMRALVIGGGGEGIGRAITRAYAAAGAAVAVADLDPGRAAAAAAELRERGTQAIALTGDVRSRADIDTWVQRTVEELGRLDVLTTVVGGQVAFVPAVKLHEMTDEDRDTVYELNLRYVARTTRSAIATFLDQGTGGAIVCVGSVTGVMAAPMQAAYGVSKAGLISLARTVAAEYAADAIRMNVISAGAVATPAAAAAQDPTAVSQIPLGRYGTVEDIAAAAVYLASPASAYMTGQTMIIDGGVSVRGPFHS